MAFLLHKSLLSEQVLADGRPESYIFSTQRFLYWSFCLSSQCWSELNLRRKEALMLHWSLWEGIPRNKSIFKSNAFGYLISYLSNRFVIAACLVSTVLSKCTTGKIFRIIWKWLTKLFIWVNGPNPNRD